MSNNRSSTTNEAPPLKTVLPCFALSELNLGRSLGTGGFSVVKEIKSVDLDEIYNGNNENESDTTNTERGAAKLRSNFATSIRTGAAKYVLKTLRIDLEDDEREKGVADLAIEAEFLQLLSHPHIISMRAKSQSDPRQSRFFVVLEQLTMTLDRKISLWRRTVGENIGFFWTPCCGYWCSKDIVLHLNWRDRLQSAADIASALQYLHQHNIVYRDLKPDNIGYDAHGMLKLFDFGLAKRLDSIERDGNGNYLLTGNTGSLRYMAPEVARDEAYNLSVDCYSFAILFWQICSLQTPYAGFNQETHALQVVQRGHRPKPDKSWPRSWTQLMTAAWSAIPVSRPLASDLSAQVIEIVAEMAEADGVVPSRASEIKAKKKRKKISLENRVLDMDSRTTSMSTTTTAAVTTIQTQGADIV